MANIVSSPAGWLPYGATDDSILAAWDGTAVPTTADFPGATIAAVGSTQTFDPELGCKVGASGSYSIASLTGYTDLDYAGQITFEVERAWLCVNNSAIGSSGDTLAANQAALGWKSAANAQGYFRQTTTKVAQFNLHGNTGADDWFVRGFVDTGNTASTITHSANKDRFVRINLGWWGNYMVVAVNGLVVSGGLLGTKKTEVMKTFYIGSDRGIGSWMADHYIRNLQISTKPPMFPVHPKLRSWALWGDSITDCNGSAEVEYHSIALDHYDESTKFQIERYFANKGLYFGNLYVGTHGGHTLCDTAHPTASGTLNDFRAALLALNPEYIIIRGGTNDAIYNNDGLYANTEVDIKDHITTMLAQASVQKVIIGTVPSLKMGNSVFAATQYDNNKAEINAIISSLDTWWDTNNPSDTGRVIVVDIDQVLGGEDGDPIDFKGSLTGAMDDLHPTATGHYKMAMAYCTIIEQILAE